MKYTAMPLLLTLIMLLPACVTNPATGDRELSLISEKQEIAMGADAHKQILASIGPYDSPKLQSYISELGNALAKASERPDLPWTFTVLDDPVVNAFALPGGYIYVTRGILAHLTTEAQIAGVLGHEIAHVTARHSASQMSKATLTNLGIGIGSVISPELAELGEVAQMGANLLFLKFGRDDERQADDLGLRYMTQLDYEPKEMLRVFETLGAVSELQGRSGLPNWLETHPLPAERVTRISEQIAGLSASSVAGRVEKEQYLQVTDGLIYGENPRYGFFDKTQFYHPDMRFQILFPAGWVTMNQTQSVGAISPQRQSALAVELVPGKSLDEAARAFSSTRNIRSGAGGRETINGIDARVYPFQLATEKGELSGQVAFFSYDGKIFRMTGYAPSPLWGNFRSAVLQTIASFGELRDESILAIQPLRLDLKRLEQPTSLEQFVRTQPSPVPIERLALINQVALGEQLSKGRLVRYVKGKALPASVAH